MQLGVSGVNIRGRERFKGRGEFSVISGGLQWVEVEQPLV